MCFKCLLFDSPSRTLLDVVVGVSISCVTPVGYEPSLPPLFPCTPSCMLFMQSLNRLCAARNRWYELLRCSSSCDRRDCSAESCWTERVEMSTPPCGDWDILRFFEIQDMSYFWWTLEPKASARSSQGGSSVLRRTRSIGYLGTFFDLRPVRGSVQPCVQGCDLDRTELASIILNASISMILGQKW